MNPLFFWSTTARSMIPSAAAHRYRQVLKIALPLVAGMATSTVMQFTDRVFLANYSLNAIAASLPAGIAAHLLIAFFSNIAGYLNVFVAQYVGARAPERVGAAIWQGIYFSLAAALVMMGFWFAAGPIFRIGGHEPAVQALEVVYFRVLCLGGGFHIVAAALSSFYSGRGITRPLMIIHTLGMLLNIPLDYALINGWWILPEMGILGAALATVASWAAIMLLLVWIVFSPENDQSFGLRRNRAIDLHQMRRLIRYGVPSSLQFTADFFAFTFFIFMVGRLGTVELAVTNIVLSIDNLSFLPLMGFSLATSTLVGQALGRNRPEAAVALTGAVLKIVLAYLLVLVAVFVLFPQQLLALFRPQHLSAASYAAITDSGVVLLRFVACFLIFDGLYMVFTGVLKGAGDTRFIMWSMGIVTVVVMIVPIYLGVMMWGAGLYACWTFVILYIFSLATIALLRFRRGKWKTMRVIETGSTPPV
jgi:MATE family multidrug resistance protein